MKVSCEHSHLNGSEILKNMFNDIDKEIYDTVFEVVGEKSKVSKEKNRKGELLYSPSVFKSEFKSCFESRGFDEIVESYHYPTCGNKHQVNGFKKIDFHKNKVGVQLQFGKYSFMIYDLAKFQYFYNQDRIDVGVEILPSYNLQKQMSSGMGYGEQLVSDIKLLKRQFPTLPLKIMIIDIDEEIQNKLI